MNFIKNNVVALVAVIIAIAGLFYPSVPSIVAHFGGVTNYDEVDATALKVGGANGSRLGPIISGTANLIASSYVTLAASTTLIGDIAVTGVVTGDYVFAEFATSSVTGGNWTIDSASASSTSGYITITYRNNTGASATIPASVASTTRYLVLHPVSTVPGL